MGVLIGAYLCASLLLYVYGINSYLMIGLFLRSQRKCRSKERKILRDYDRTWKQRDLPYVTTQLPIYNERHVVKRLIRAVCAFDYPRERHEIQVLDDSTDETFHIVADLVGAMRAEGHNILHVRRATRDGFKAGALAEGTTRARGEFFALFDADFVPPPDFLKRTLPFLMDDESCGFVQTRWGHRNRGFSALTFAQSIGIDGHFVVEQPARAWNGLFFNFNGTAGVWRRTAMENAGGWRADTLTEDLDLSYRTLLAGWKARYLLDVITPAEIPSNINALKSQQRRWAKGSIETAMKLLPRVWRGSPGSLFKKIQATIHLTHYLIHPLILAITLLVLPLLYLVHLRFTAVHAGYLIALMFLALLGPSTLYVFSQGVSRGNWRRTLLWMPGLMALGIGLAVNNTMAVAEALVRKKSDFIRTPKLGALAEKSSIHDSRPPGSAYQSSAGRLYIYEICTGLWAAVAFITSAVLFRGVASPFLLIQTAGFLYVGIMSYLHGRPRERAG